MINTPTIHLTYRKTPSATGRPSNSLYTVTDDTGRDLCSARTPLFAAARILLREGQDPASTVFMTCEGEISWSLRAPLSIAAKLTVRENDSAGPIFVAYDTEKMSELKARKLAAKFCRLDCDLPL